MQRSLHIWAGALCLLVAGTVRGQTASVIGFRAAGHELSRTLRDTASDQKAIWTSPFRVSRREATAWLLLGGGTLGLIAADRRLEDRLPKDGRQVRIGHAASNMGALSTLYPVAGGLYLSGVVFESGKARETGRLAAEALTDSLIVVNLLKIAASRERPSAGSGRGSFRQAGNRGFPSGHSMLTWTLASVISHEYGDSRAIPALAYGAAAMVSASRFMAGEHYASDILVGSTIGWFIGRHVYNAHSSERSNGRAWTRPRITPQLRPRSSVYGVSLVWEFSK